MQRLHCRAARVTWWRFMGDFNGYDVDAVGWTWIAYCALRGDGSMDAFLAASKDVEKRLGIAGVELHEAGLRESAKTVSDAHLLVIAFAEMLNSDGTSEYKIEFKRRKKGKPINRHQRAQRGHRAAGIVRRLETEGWKTEAAVEQATTDTGLSRAEIFSWISHDKKVMAMSPGELADRLNASITKTD